MTHLGDAIRRARGKRTLRWMGAELVKAGVLKRGSVAYLSDIERGNVRGFGGDRLTLLANVLGVDPETLMDAAELDDGFVIPISAVPEDERWWFREIARTGKWHGYPCEFDPPPPIERRLSVMEG